MRAPQQRGEKPGGRHRRFENNPVKPIERRCDAIDAFRILRRDDAEGRRHDGFGAEVFQRITEFACAIERAGHDNPLAEEWALIEPASVLPKANDVADQQPGTVRGGVAARRQLQQLADRARDSLLARLRSAERQRKKDAAQHAADLKRAAALKRNVQSTRARVAAAEKALEGARAALSAAERALEDGT